MTHAREPGKSIPPRLIGTYDDELTLLFSQGYKNFKDKTPCNWCSLRKPMMHRFATAKKGEAVTFGDKIFCSVDCFRKRDQSPNLDVQQPLAP